MHGGPVLAYETPVLGYPWSIPFEFPLFQMLAAAVAKLTSLPLDSAGRLVSFLFYLATAWTLFELRRQLELPAGYALTAATLYLFSPLYRFWGRSFMIESCALFLAAAFLVLILAGSRATDLRKALLTLAVAALIGTLAALVKVTTFAVFLLAAVALVVSARRGILFRKPRQVATRPSGLPWYVWLVALLVPVAAVAAWTGFADSQKALNPIGQRFVSSNQHGWLFGWLAQRFDPSLWVQVIITRSVSEAIGSWSAVILAGVAAVWLRGPARALVLCLLTLFISAFLVFTNLHVVHNYYQYANSIFLIMAAATCLWVASRKTPALLVLLLVVLVLQDVEFRKGYARAMFGPLDATSRTTLSVSNVLRSRTKPDDVVLVYGYEWSSEIAYYAQRRTVTVPDWDSLQVDVLRNVEHYAGSNPLGAIVVCPRTRTDAQFEATLKLAVADMTHDATTACRVFVAGS
jgi:4-amino-4-deoxy-L-arabinose transferase-like glycosyltransferase